MQPTAPNGTMTIVDKRGSGTGRGYSFFVFDKNRLGLQLADTSGPTNYVTPLSSPFVLADGRWHFVAVTVDRRRNIPPNTSRIRFYNDGVLVYTVTPAQATKAGSLANTSPLRIGRTTFATFGAFRFKGDIDELEIFNRELSGAEVNSIFMAKSAGKCK